jgi:hypothetical protein
LRTSGAFHPVSGKKQAFQDKGRWKREERGKKKEERGERREERGERREERLLRNAARLPSESLFTCFLHSELSASLPAACLLLYSLFTVHSPAFIPAGNPSVR